jgi:transcriptional regulator with XRE-family HTH domain
MNEERIVAALDAELERRAGRATDTPTPRLDPAEQAEVDALLEIADLLWESADYPAPPLESDPTAIMLGLVPDPSFKLDAKALKKQRTRLGMDIKTLATLLSERGWQDVTVGTVFGWERQQRVGLCPALIRSIAAVLGVSEDAVSVRQEVEETALDRAVKRPRFLELAQEWAADHGLSLDVARPILTARLAVAVRRGDDLDEDQYIEALEHLVAAQKEADQ